MSRMPPRFNAPNLSPNIPAPAPVAAPAAAGAPPRGRFVTFEGIDGADAEKGQVPRGEAAAQRLAAVFDVSDELLDRLRLEQVGIHSASTMGPAGGNGP